MLMRCEIRVVPSAIVQGSHFANLADPAERLERAVNRRQRDIWMYLTYFGVDFFCTRVSGRGEQGFDNR